MGVRKLAAWMGLVEDGRYQDDDINDADDELTDDVYVDEDEPSAEVSRVQALPQRRPKPVAPVAAPQKEVADMSRIVSVRPRSYNEARVIGENFRDGDIVVFDLVDLEPGERKRYLDFVAGLAFALRGRIEADGTRFTLLPEGVELSDTDRDRLSV